MSTDRTLEREVTAAFLDAAPSHEPDGLYESIISTTRPARPRARLRALIKESPMRYRSRLVVGSPSLRLAAIVATVAALLPAIVGAVAVGASALPSPAPVQPSPAEPSPVVGLVRNGLIAYGANGGIDALDPGTGVTATIVQGTDLCCPTWSPDGRHLAYYATTMCCRAGGTFDGVLHVVAADGSGDVQVTREPVRNRYLVQLVSWAPDSRRLAYADLGRIFVFDLASGTSTDTGIVAPFAAWSPDGQWLAFDGVTPEGGESHGIFLTTPDGGNERRLTSKPSPAIEGWVSWSPDSALLAFACCDSDASESSHIWTADREGSVRQLTAGRARETQPVWSPDGTRLAYERSAGPDAWIVVSDADGSGRHSVSQIPMGQGGGPAATFTWSPDGTMLLAAPYRALSFEVIPLDGSPSTNYSLTFGSASWQPLVP